MSAHSPGPWYFHNNAAGYDELRSPNGEVIAMWGEWPALTKADAELIRSAPDMLALLRFLSTKSFYAENGEIDDGCAFCGGSGYHVGVCDLAALLARIDGAANEVGR